LSDYDPASRPSRAAWKDRYGAYLDQQRARREQADQIRRDYREILGADCVHGSRKRVIGQSGDRFWAGLECPKSDARCGVNFLSPEHVYHQWRDGTASRLSRLNTAVDR
jgi:hypothetical protein